MDKITKKMLNDYRDMRKKNEIQILEAELVYMRQGDNGFDNSTIFDYRDGYPRPQSVIGFDQKKYDKRLESLNRKKAMMELVAEWIEGIEDGQTRCIFRMFYTDGEEWEAIAQKTGYSKHPDYPRKMYRDPYLEKMGIK